MRLARFTRMFHGSPVSLDAVASSPIQAEAQRERYAQAR
jgi:hypothetical protein